MVPGCFVLWMTVLLLLVLIALNPIGFFNYLGGTIELKEHV